MEDQVPWCFTNGTEWEECDVPYCKTTHAMTLEQNDAIWRKNLKDAAKNDYNYDTLEDHDYNIEEKTGYSEEKLDSGSG